MGKATLRLEHPLVGAIEFPVELQYEDDGSITVKPVVDEFWNAAKYIWQSK